MFTPLEIIVTMMVIAFATMLTRFTPFLLFPDSKKPPKIIAYLSTMLPCAMMGLLVVYCIKDVSLTKAPYGCAEWLAILCVYLLHRWKSNMLLSIGGGTLLYMFLVQVVFL